MFLASLYECDNELNSEFFLDFTQDERFKSPSLICSWFGGFSANWANLVNNKTHYWLSKKQFWIQIIVTFSLSYCKVKSNNFLKLTHNVNVFNLPLARPPNIIRSYANASIRWWDLINLAKVFKWVGMYVFMFSGGIPVVRLMLKPSMCISAPF